MAESTITRNINDILLRNEISKTEFYEKCGITSGAFSQWNTGKTTPRLKTLQRIADFLCVPLSEITGEELDGAEETEMLGANEVLNGAARETGDELVENLARCQLADAILQTDMPADVAERLRNYILTMYSKK